MSDTSSYKKTFRKCCKATGLLLLAFILVPSFAFCGNGDDENNEEITVTLNVQRIGSAEIPAIIQKETVFLSVKDIFDFLKINNNPSQHYDSLSGFFINPKALFLIDATNHHITYEDRSFDIKPGDIIHTETNLFLRSDYFGQVFGLGCSFNFRSLSVNLTTKIELPAIREMQQELMRKNISQLKGEKKADTTLKRNYPLFKLGMADWYIVSTKDWSAAAKGNASINNTRVNVGVGAIVAGGEANFYLNYNSSIPLAWKQQYYYWHFVDNDFKPLRQITLGKIFTQSTATLNAPIKGFQLSNTPSTYRRSFGNYTLSNTTEPGWMVELYVNNVLVNYVKADASGFYSFDVPMVYGSTIVKLRFISPWGEERIKEQFISIPFNFIPLHQLEYNLTGGVVDNDSKDKFYRANINYGLDKHVTIGAGVEHLSSVTSGKNMPFINTSVRLGSNVLISAEHAYGVRTKGILTYHLPSNLQVELNYTKYNTQQTAVKFNYLEEKKAVVSVPFHLKKFFGFSRLTWDEFKLAKTRFTTTELLLSATKGFISTNFTTYALFPNTGDPFIYSNLAFNLRVLRGVRITPQLQYEYVQKKTSMVKCEVEKNLFTHGFINLAYENYITSNTKNFVVGFRYNFSFARTSFLTRQSGSSVTTTQSASGSLVYDNSTNYLGINNQSNLGKGGIIVSPYLDVNCNGKHDADEPKVNGLKLHINGGRIERNEKDTSVRIVGLEAYANYYLEFDKNSFENIAWQMPKNTMNVTVEPNHFKIIELPVSVVGEVSGTVYFNGNKGMSGLGRIIVNFYNSDSVFVAKVQTESDGYFELIGLKPGTYIAKVDEEQLRKLQMTSTPPLTFTIKQTKDGDIAEGLKFVLKPL